MENEIELFRSDEEVKDKLLEFVNILKLVTPSAAAQIEGILNRTSVFLLLLSFGLLWLFLMFMVTQSQDKQTSSELKNPPILSCPDP